jgi:hypothetical protein
MAENTASSQDGGILDIPLALPRSRQMTGQYQKERTGDTVFNSLPYLNSGN